MTKTRNDRTRMREDHCFKLKLILTISRSRCVTETSRNKTDTPCTFVRLSLPYQNVGGAYDQIEPSTLVVMNKNPIHLANIVDHKKKAESTAVECFRIECNLDQGCVLHKQSRFNGRRFLMDLNLSNKNLLIQTCNKAN
jgi:hypothetical protein